MKEDGATWDMDEPDGEPLPNPEAALEEYNQAMEEYNRAHGAAHHNNAHLQPQRSEKQMNRYKIRSSSSRPYNVTTNSARPSQELRGGEGRW